MRVTDSPSQQGSGIAKCRERCRERNIELQDPPTSRAPLKPQPAGAHVFPSAVCKPMIYTCWTTCLLNNLWLMQWNHELLLVFFGWLAVNSLCAILTLKLVKSTFGLATLHDRDRKNRPRGKFLVYTYNNATDWDLEVRFGFVEFLSRFSRPMTKNALVKLVSLFGNHRISLWHVDKMTSFSPL